MESIKQKRVSVVILSLVMTCLLLFGLMPQVHAQETSIAPQLVTLSADLTDDTLIAPQQMYVEYGKFSDLGLKVKNDDPGFITPLHVLIQYYTDTKGAAKDTMSQYIQVDEDGNLLKLEGYDGGSAPSENNQWIYALDNYFRGDENVNKVYPMSDIPVGTNLQIYGMDKTASSFYYEIGYKPVYVLEKGKSTTMNFKGISVAPKISFNKAISIVSGGADMTGATAWVKKVSSDGMLVDAEADKDYTLIGEIKKTGLGLKAAFNEAGTYYFGADKKGDDGKSLITHNTSTVIVRESADLISDYEKISGNVEITADGTTLTNFSTGKGGSEISWSASSPIVSFEKSGDDLVVKANTDGLTQNTPVRLTATIKNSGETLTKDIAGTIVIDETIQKINSDLNAIKWAGKESLNDDTEYTDKNFFAGANGTTFTWESSDNELLKTDTSETGKLKLIMVKQPNATTSVTLTITGILDGKTAVRKVSCWIVPLSDEAIVAKDAAATVLKNGQNVFSGQHNFVVDNSGVGEFGTTKTWSCSKPELLDFDTSDNHYLKVATHNETLEEDTSVDVYCTVSYGTASIKKTFENCTVQASTQLKALSIEGVEDFTFDPSVHIYNFTMQEGQEIKISATPFYKGAYIEINDQRVEAGEKYTHKLNTEQSLDKVSIKIKREGVSNSGSYTLNFAKATTELPNYTAQWGRAHYNFNNIRVVAGLAPRTSEEIDLEKSWHYAISTAGAGMVGWGKWSYPIVVNNNIYAAGDDNLFKFDMDGNLIAKTKMSNGVLGGGYTGWLAYGDGMIFVPTGNGVMAFNADDLGQLWTGNSGVSTVQGSCPVVYKDGYVYTGTTAGTSGQGGYYCFDTKDDDPAKTNEVKDAVWVLNTEAEDGNSSFYWAGATIVGDHLIIPNDSGYIYSIDIAASVQQKKPVITQKLNNDGIMTNIRTAIVYDENTKSIYYPTYNKKTYKVVINDDGTFGDVKSVDIGDAGAQNPVLYNGRLYLGNSVVDAQTMQLIYTARVGEGAQASPSGGWTVSTSYSGDTQTVYLYGHAGNNPDKIMVWKDSPANTADNPATIEAIWTNNMSPQFTTSNFVITPEGSIVFVNDSANLFCIKSTVTQEQIDAEKTFQGVIDKIDALPEASKVQHSDKANIEAARIAYNALSPEDQAKVTNYQKLVGCEAALKALQDSGDKEAAAKVDGLIIALPQPEDLVYDADKDAVKAAKAAYDALTDTQKALVQNTGKLNACIEKMEELKTVQGYVTFDIERFTIGQGYFVEPVKVPFYDGDNARTILQRVIGEENYLGEDTYMRGIKGADAGVDKVIVPDYISKLGALAPTTEDAREYGNAYEESILGEHSYNSMSGWMYAVNNVFPGYGISSYEPKDGDVVRFQFTLWGTGMDLTGEDYNSGEIVAEISNKDELTKALAAVNSGSKEDLLKNEAVKTAYDNAMKIAPEMTAPQTDVSAAADALNSAVTAAKEAEKDEQAAQTVADQIMALPPASQLTLADKGAVEAVRATYNSLTEAQRGYISSDVLKTLEDAEAQILKLEEEVNKPAPTPTPETKPEASDGGAGSTGTADKIGAAVQTGNNAGTGIAAEQTTGVWGAMVLLAAAGLTGAALIRKRKKS